MQSDIIENNKVISDMSVLGGESITLNPIILEENYTYVSTPIGMCFGYKQEGNILVYQIRGGIVKRFRCKLGNIRTISWSFRHECLYVFVMGASKHLAYMLDIVNDTLRLQGPVDMGDLHRRIVFSKDSSPKTVSDHELPICLDPLNIVSGYLPTGIIGRIHGGVPFEYSKTHIYVGGKIYEIDSTPIGCRNGTVIFSSENENYWITTTGVHIKQPKLPEQDAFVSEGVILSKKNRSVHIIRPDLGVNINITNVNVMVSSHRKVAYLEDNTINIYCLVTWKYSTIIPDLTDVRLLALVGTHISIVHNTLPSLYSAYLFDGTCILYRSTINIFDSSQNFLYRSPAIDAKKWCLLHSSFDV